MRDWFRGFFDERYLDIITAQKGRHRTVHEVDFVVRALKLKKGARILDVPCGFGRHCAELSRRGFDVVGVDLSRAMISEGRRRFPKLKLLRGDMRRIDFRGEFDAAINMFTSFGYFSHRENIGVLGRLARALKPGGIVLIDHRDPEYDEKKTPKSWWARFGRNLFVFGEHNVKNRVQKNTWLILRLGESRVIKKWFRVREYALPEWRRMFRRAGLRFVAAYRNYKMQPYLRLASPRLIVVARKPDSIS